MGTAIGEIGTKNDRVGRNATTFAAQEPTGVDAIHRIKLLHVDLEHYPGRRRSYRCECGTADGQATQPS
jgi:hypothetical protein